MSKFIRNGKTMPFTATAALAVGDVVVVGSIVGVAQNAAAIGEVVELALEGVYEVPKVAATVIAQGAMLYWDESESEATTTATGNVAMGFAFAGGASADETVLCKLVVPITVTVTVEVPADEPDPEPDPDPEP